MFYVNLLLLKVTSGVLAVTFCQIEACLLISFSNSQWSSDRSVLFDSFSKLQNILAFPGEFMIAYAYS